ncbi:MAG: ribulose-phosphate 3-epimerase [Actinobacteria bacterium]|uniref:ribulose-phosphate 3-epimerase n=1 Tax=freshwater metagenome TaxID=449393 RepID=A0A6J7CPU9_9ZZZZ|nr:ribulose-phosphate 3-epimerase [Actinomycetota bacterium]MSX24532.1 ribulose-phosphate 3-epimerase [Actinomycetota bacterium]MSY46829.1 ribulose-phosphate 3-epimerase [Actinomycetota bacterium]MTB00216.1 ribulose-phosphate 3-epimerase [Actinomycetota bacterium]
MTREIRITPSILNADFTDLGSEIRRISEVSDLVHLDVMDNIFVPNFTFSFEAASKIVSDSVLPVDAHLMVMNCDQIGPQFAEIGCSSVTIHSEATTNISSTLRTIRSLGSRAGLAIKPGTDIDDYASFADEVDMFLIMTVEPGFGGQSFMEPMLQKISRTRSIIGNRPIWLQVDGGISLKTIEQAAQAGADTFVAGSAVFSAEDPASMVTALRKLAESVL